MSRVPCSTGRCRTLRARISRCACRSVSSLWTQHGSGDMNAATFIEPPRTPRTSAPAAPHGAGARRWAACSVRSTRRSRGKCAGARPRPRPDRSPPPPGAPRGRRAALGRPRDRAGPAAVPATRRRRGAGARRVLAASPFGPAGSCAQLLRLASPASVPSQPPSHEDARAVPARPKGCDTAGARQLAFRVARQGPTPMPESILEELKRYVAFGAGDERALRTLHPIAKPHFDRISELFYERILQHEAARKA